MSTRSKRTKLKLDEVKKSESELEDETESEDEAKVKDEAMSEDEAEVKVEAKSEDEAEVKDEAELENDTKEDLADYERLRLKNIEERQQFLKSLGVDSILEDIKPLLPIAVDKKDTPTKPRPKRICWLECVGRRPNSERIQTMEVKNYCDVPVRIKVEKKPRIKVKREAKEIYIEPRPPSLRIQNMKERMKHRRPPVEELESSIKLEDERNHGPFCLGFRKKEAEKLVAELKNELKQPRKYDPNIDLTTCTLQSFRESIDCFKMVPFMPRLVPMRIQSACVHSSTIKRLVIAGCTDGNIGLWDMDMKMTDDTVDDVVKCWMPHIKPVNCLSVSSYNPCTIYSTSHDGTVFKTDINQNEFHNLYMTDFNTKMNHLTWHEEKEASTLLVAHGDGSVGILDTRCLGDSISKSSCFVRSVRTVQVHPVKRDYFIASSGLGFCRIYDLRKFRRDNAIPVCSLDHLKGLTSAFFSGQGNFVITTCNDNFIRTYDVSDLASEPTVKSKAAHNNHSGQWLSTFKAIWYPNREDAWIIGSMMKPRVIQVYGADGNPLGNLSDEMMLTISPVIAVHPTLPLIVGGNSRGRVHAFTIPPHSP